MSDITPVTVALYGLAAVGGLVALLYVENVLSFFYAHFLRPCKNIKTRFGSWTVVTGATDGIGKAMAFEFAKKGLNVVLISRSKEKLDECAAELSAKYPKVQVKVLAVDYSDFSAPIRAKVIAFLEGLDVGVLVNNVGISYPYTKFFHELDDERVAQLISLNVESTTWMSRIVLPGMITRKRGAIVNIGSAAGVSASPLLAQYGAAKSYIAMLSKGMNVELKCKGIHVQCDVPMFDKIKLATIKGASILVPMFVATKLAKIKRASLFVASPSSYARAAVAAIGYESLVSPYWSHAFQIWLLTALPEWVVAGVTFNMHMGIRSAGMKKDARVAEGEADPSAGKKKK